MRELWRSAFAGFRHRRLRTALTVCGIAIGTAMVVLVSGIGALGQAAVQQELEDMGVHGLSVSASDGLNEDCLFAIRELPAVRQAMPLILEYTTAHFPVGSDYGVVSCGIDAGADQLISLQLLHGRLFSHGDVASSAAVCVVDSSLAKAVYGRENVVGKTLSVLLDQQRVPLTVVGVTATGSSLLKTVSAMIPHMIYMPYTTLQSYTGDASIDQIAVRVSSDAVGTEDTIRRALSHEPVGTLKTEDLASQRERLESVASILTAVLTAVGGVSLLVSGFGIMTSMLSSVNERTREIGIKKAVGAGRGRILLEFLAAAVLLSFVGAVIGTALGGGVVIVACRVLELPVPDVVGGWSLAFLFTLFLGAAFGSYPAYVASGMAPVEALRQEL